MVELKKEKHVTISKDDVAIALRTQDIEGLIKAGAPGDEYDSEATSIALALQNMSKDQLIEANIIAVIALVWQKSFNRSPEEIKMRLPVFQQIAHSLLS